MKTVIALGLVILSLLLLLVPLRSSGRPPVPERRPTTAEAHPVSMAAPPPRAASDALRTTQHAQSVHPMLLAAIETETNPDRRSEAIERLVESVPDADLFSLLDLLALETSPEAVELSLRLVRRRAESDPPAAAIWTLQLPESPVSRAALEQVAIAWANTDLPAAAGWVQALPEGDSKQATTFALAYEASRTEPITALEVAGKLLPTRERDDLLVHAVSQWAATDSITAATWAIQVPEATLRERLVAAVAVASAELDGAAAATLAANVLGAGDEQDRATVAIVQRWAQSSPQAAAAWVSQFPDIPSREAAVRNLLALWTANDAKAAGNWLDGLPDGSLRDTGLTAYVQALADRDQTSAELKPAGGM